MDAAVLDLLPFAIVELSPIRNSEGRIIDFEWVAANETAERTIFPEGGTMVGMRACELDPAYGSSDIFAASVRCIESGTRQEISNTGRRPTPDGRLKHLQGTVVRYSILPRGDNCIVCSAEVTEIAHERDAARDSYELFRTAFNHAVQGITLSTETSEIIYANDALHKLLGYEPGELHGKSTAVILCPEDQAMAMKVGRQLFKGTIKQDIQDRNVLTKDGRELLVSSALSCAWSEARGEHIFISHARDVREERETARELEIALRKAEHATNLKSEFLANMSHEIRTPLNGILGMAQVLSHADLREDQSEQVDIILESGQNLLSILNDILDLSKIEAGRLDISTIDTDLRHRLDGTRKLYASIAAEKGIGLDLFVDPSVPSRLKIDPVRVRQCVSNLVSNAIKFTAKGNVLIAATARPKQDGRIRVTVHVSDTGCGIPEDKMDRIFEPFAQADGSTTRKYGGSGLGLPIARQLARMMGGDISVVSQPGRGTVFTLKFDAEPASQAVGTGDVKAISGVDRGKATETTAPKVRLPRILIVDDNEINRRVAWTFLEQNQLEPDEAANGLIALEKLEKSRYDLVLMDVHMPGLDGQKAFERLRASDGMNADIPVVALTADSMRGDREKFIAKGFSGYVAKPIDMRSLIAVIADCLNLKVAPEERRRHG
ncbi:hybrid sensor histidine kinase/response regulator [Hyphomonas johnsonii]|uniref:Sensory/regulatory protein RpfC n=1 Tax=Hyphomonas johnsonii MHS-2 TaxID=1280950 RepID=A0A059FE97_9PROT|nr:ATP-binding protein [Hyphomonas johnsonii]KCZ88871.1 sensory box sensor histidine kinase/response regulator [Hyphomonas johnsonii MHS-2]